MNEQSIKKLRRNFILYSMTVLTMVMLSIAGLIFAANLYLTRNQIESILNYIVENDGDIQDAKTIRIEHSSESEDDAEEDPLELDRYGLINYLRELFGTDQADYSRISTFSTRYFAVLFDADEVVTEIKTNHIDYIDTDTAEQYARSALTRWSKFGRYDVYYYQVAHKEDGSSIVVYLDSTDQVRSTSRLLYSAMMLIGFGVVIAFIFVFIFSSRAIAPEIRGAEIQKSFITNASHELKTPLAVIRANTEMEEMLSGETEWTQSTLRQIDRLDGLIANLVTIARAQEKETAKRDDTDISRVMRETVETFAPVAEQAGKKMILNAPETFVLKSSESKIRQLVSLLVDNAIKYCDDEGTITVSLIPKAKWFQVIVSNDYAEGSKVDYSRFFERFYRQDESHNISKGGYGIGLSIAQSITEQFDGSIRAEWKDGVISFICSIH